MGIMWPFPTRDGIEWDRVDQGQDLRAPVGTPVLAVGPGVIQLAHDPNGFGDPYPYLVLDTPEPHGRAVYYGHQHPEVIGGVHVEAGQVIAHAAQVPGGNAKDLPGWLEIGWWDNGPTGDGQAMHDALSGAAETNQKGEVLDVMPKTVRQGDNGQAVRNVQALLNTHDANLPVDGVFGPATAAKVHDFQTVAGLPADQVVGPNTWAALLTLGT